MNTLYNAILLRIHWSYLFKDSPSFFRTSQSVNRFDGRILSVSQDNYKDEGFGHKPIVFLY